MDLVSAATRAGWLLPSDTRDRPRAGAGRPEHSGLLGIDIGGTKIHISLWEAAGIRETQIATDTSSRSAVIDGITRATEDLAGDIGISAAAVGVPGIIRPDGSLSDAPNLPGWSTTSITSALRTSLGRPVVVHNDVHMAALGEQYITGASHLTFIAIGTGIGSGSVVEGNLVRGAGGAAGEIFDLPVVIEGRTFQLEDVASGNGLARHYEKSGGGVATTYEIVSRRSTCAIAQRTITAFARAVALAAKAAQCFYDSAEVVIGGGLGSREEILAAIQQEADRLPGRPLSVRRSVLGAYAGAFGALATALRLPG